jgi:phosphoglycolate phosphatase-like HAD superfamily hydrolase
MPPTLQDLRGFEPSRPFLVAVDSDGCVFDNYEIRHRECAVPLFIGHFGLQPVSRLARETWEFSALYSRTRGVNRFALLSNVLNLLAERPELQARGVSPRASDDIDLWLASAGCWTNAALLEEVERGTESLRIVVEWSLAVDGLVESMVRGIPPFAMARETLAALQEVADVVVLGDAPTEAVERAWSEQGLTDGVRLIAGEELGSKAEVLKALSSGKYEPRHTLMIGDSPPDFRAAMGANALFWPILPLREEWSWKLLFDEGVNRFKSDQLAGSYASSLMAPFDACLPADPPWKSV